jgi:hypothetical protein
MALHRADCIEIEKPIAANKAIILSNLRPCSIMHDTPRDWSLGFRITIEPRLTQFLAPLKAQEI